MGDKLTEIERALASFRMDEARELAQKELDENPSATAYYLASQAALNHGQRVDYLEKALELDPTYQVAQDELAEMSPEEVKSKRADEPEETEFRLAGITRRFLAIIIDGIIVAIATFAIMAVSDSFAPLYDAMYSADDLAVSAAFNQFQTDTIIINLVVSAVYNVVLMTLLNGQTLGKLAFSMRVVKKNGRRVSILDALLRNVFGYTVSQIFLLGYLWAIFDKEQQAWHDKMAGTVVVDERKTVTP